MWMTTNERDSTHWDCWTKKERVSGGRKMRRLRVEIGVVGGGGHWVRCLFVFHVMYQTPSWSYNALVIAMSTKQSDAECN
jgi:hypothetical protein